MAQVEKSGAAVTQQLRILLVDDDPFTLATVSSMLRTLDFEVVATATTAAAGLRAGHELKPDVAVVDLDLGEGPTGIDLAHRLREVHPSIGLVVLSTYIEPRLMGYNQPPLPEGSVYLVKQTVVDAEILGSAVTLSLSSEPFDTGFVSAVTGTSLDNLTDLQVDLMRMVAAGYSNVEIARRRSMTVPSVENSINRLIKGLDLQASAEQNQRVLVAQAYFQLTGAVRARRS